MEAKHTPGPWQAINGHYIVDVRANNQSIIGEGMRIEDARLIAAAPDLLAVLKAVAIAEDFDDIEMAKEAARAAIAKAEGGQ